MQLLSSRKQQIQLLIPVPRHLRESSYSWFSDLSDLVPNPANFQNTNTNNPTPRSDISINTLSMLMIPDFFYVYKIDR